MPYIRVRPEGLQRMSEMLDRVEKDIEQREEAFKKSSTSKNGGKGNSGKQQVVETVAIDPKAVKAMAKEAQEKQQPVVEKDGEER